jgi:hypothetical protein
VSLVIYENNLSSVVKPHMNNHHVLCLRED